MPSAGRYLTRCLLVLSWLASVISPAAGPSCDLSLSRASYLGGPAADQSGGVVFAKDGTVVWGGLLGTGFQVAGVVPQTLLAGGQAGLVRFDPDLAGVQSLAFFCDELSDLATSSAGFFACATDRGAVIINNQLDSVRWHDPLSARRIDVNASGSVAVLIDDRRIRSFDDQGMLRGDQTLADVTRIEDVAIDDSDRILITGYTQVSSNLKTPFLRAYDVDLDQLLWQSYGFSNAELTAQGLGADSEGRRLTIGQDGFLYLAGTTDGGNTVFTRDPKDSAERLPAGGNPALHTLIQTDRFNQPVMLSGAAKFSFHGRFSAINGHIVKGQFLLARLSSGNHNTLRILDIQADPEGNMLLVGVSASDLEDRACRTINGVSVGGYAGGDGFLMLLSADYRERLAWTPFNGAQPVGSRMVAVAARGRLTSPAGSFVLAGTLNNPTDAGFLLTAPFQQHAGGDEEAYLAARILLFPAGLPLWPESLDVVDLLGLPGVPSG